ncbi:MAG TPA: ABC transporter permease [Solirubrobacteraceae bacterium]|nr:ABC transporter permease [Solirubrobacteraceae bacterium]
MTVANTRAHELGPPIPGPSALGGSARRFAYLAATLAVTEFKLRFFGSALGYLWQLVRPLMLFGVLYLVFTEFVKIGDRVAFYPVVLLANIVLFTFFQEGTGAVGSVVDREGLVRKIHFPRMAIPVSVVLTAGFNLVLNLLVVMAFAVASGVRPRWSWLQAPVLVLLLAALVLGLAMLLSALYVRYRDVKPIWEVALQALFYGTPVIYAVETIGVSKTVQELIMMNPVAAILEQFRHAVIDPAAPTAAAAAGGTLRLLVPLGILVAVCALGYRVFDRAAPHIAEEL